MIQTPVEAGPDRTKAQRWKARTKVVKTFFSGASESLTAKSMYGGGDSKLDTMTDS